MIDLNFSSSASSVCLWAVVGLIAARCAAEWSLERLNQRHVRAHAGRVPDAFAGVVDQPTYVR